MNKKGISLVVVGIVVVAVVVVGVVAYWAMTNTGGGNGGNGGNGGEDVYTVENATSLQFTVTATEGTSMGTVVYSAKNIGTSDMMIRVDIEMEELTISYIVNGAQQKAWANEGSGWVLYDAFLDQWDAWDSTWQGYTDNLSGWTAGEWTYTDADGYTVTVSDIAVNPSLEDSFFEAET
jgi:hypothetical protein